MSEESLSSVAKFVARISSKNGRRGAQIHACFVGTVLSVWITIHIIDPNLVIAASLYFYITAVYAVMSLFAMALLVSSQPFITPEVRQPECNYCGGPMSTTRLRCERCSSKANK